MFITKLTIVQYSFRGKPVTISLKYPKLVYYATLPELNFTFSVFWTTSDWELALVRWRKELFEWTPTFQVTTNLKTHQTNIIALHMKRIFFVFHNAAFNELVRFKKFDIFFSSAA